MHVIISFENERVEKTALAKLLGRFPFKTWKTGRTMVPESALPFLACEGVSYRVEGAAKYDEISPIRDVAAAGV